jgi:hypothetical protein
MGTSSEYDAFGPWIDEVKTVADLPRLFRTSGIDPAAHHLVLKVPRNIERRNATPGMHLYDRVLAVGDDTLTVLTRTGDSFETRPIPLDQIVAIEYSSNMLEGSLTLHALDGSSISISYNGAAHAPVHQLVTLLRRLYMPPVPAPETSTAPAGQNVPDLGALDVNLMSAYRAMNRQEPLMRVISSTTRRVVATSSGLLGRLLRVGRPITLQASIAATDDRELQMLHRREWFTRGSDGAASNYSMARTVLPLSRISEFQVEPHERYDQMHNVVIHAGDTRLRFPVPADQDTAAALGRIPIGRSASDAPLLAAGGPPPGEQP